MYCLSGWGCLGEREEERKTTLTRQGTGRDPTLCGVHVHTINHHVKSLTHQHSPKLQTANNSASPHVNKSQTGGRNGERRKRTRMKMRKRDRGHLFSIASLLKKIDTKSCDNSRPKKW